MIRFGKNKVGDWVLIGPVAEMRVGTVDVELKSGAVIPQDIIILGKEYVTEEGQRLCYGYLAAQPRRPKGRSCAECGWRPTVALKADKAGVVAPVCLFCERAKSSELDFAKQRMLL